jgi:hypothetical protein
MCADSLLPLVLTGFNKRNRQQYDKHVHTTVSHRSKGLCAGIEADLVCVVVQVDFPNAFNEIIRSAVLAAVTQHAWATSSSHSSGGLTVSMLTSSLEARLLVPPIKD